MIVFSFVSIFTFIFIHPWTMNRLFDTRGKAKGCVIFSSHHHLISHRTRDNQERNC